ncbi:MAG: 50S ribosomal protein L6 [Candidatus Colwellbacteria bacterium RIFCSPLOWO2_12_FULL_44_13]|uniref:50S ribosomal protein L6 n=3 Tax=Candidatus Colwelliibacteriota TaxID=1817904 RepID=A0A1G1Z6P9_9BACT|nr:MAG: 50S ribosomal protein L6 [Candidatus Colwellbacteria bacterium RIFCSPHIGHO2_12_FULL_44_17]OGY60301.1 MAG: 50S ribosomal protein L6 [Candidatus Colwellbacteria bacterium RIFCSPLOWO2_02_FULL_44_20b]OGY61514.1 MAG: 50S ribosomal protein L6 [Candidatus Colwellbacteria bacterium RIFCSPLOWO2_12_FULL_44_13]
MSKIAKKPIGVPEGVTATMGESEVSFKGKNGSLTVPILPYVKLDLQEGAITVTAVAKTKQALSNWGTMGALVKNAIAGAQTDFMKELVIEGVGFRVALEGKILVLSIGFSHPVKFAIPEGIKLEVEKNTMKISGPDKALVGETAAKIRELKKPEPYKGKGIRYVDEVIRRKAGKKVAGTTA